MHLAHMFCLSLSNRRRPGKADDIIGFCPAKAYIKGMTGSRLTAGLFAVLALLVCLGVNTNANAARPTGEIPEREFTPANSNNMVLRVQKALTRWGCICGPVDGRMTA